MAHNNGMVPRGRGKARAGKASDNTAKFRTAVQAAPAIAAHPNLDPPYPATPLDGLSVVPEPGAEVAAFVPPRPARPEKSEGGKRFKLVSEYEPAGDQPTAIAELVKGVEALDRDQVLLGVTGSGKTFTMA